MTDHLHDDLELYALGMLDTTERELVDTHVATCAECLQRLVEAEAVGAALASTLPQYTPSPALAARITASLHPRASVTRLPRVARASWLATAAALLLFVGVGRQNYEMGVALRSQDVILATIVHSHFDHVSLTTSTKIPGFGAKALYARDGSWVYLVIDHPPVSLHVIAMDAGGAHDLGEPIRENDVATLFLHPTERITALDLSVNGESAATGKLVY